jgi:hypothetical protein
MASTELSLSQSMQDISASIQSEYKDIMDGIQAKLSAPSGNTIRLTQNKKFVLPDGVESDGPLDVVIVGFTSRNVYYSGQFNPNNITPPDCFAEGDNPSLMAPSDKAEMKQAEDCNECPMNQFGSNGNGKACQNQRIIAVLPVGKPDAEIMTIRVSPSAIKGFDNYVSGLNTKYKVPPFAVVTQVTFDPSTTYAKLMFGNPIPNPEFKAFADRAVETPQHLAANFVPAASATLGPAGGAVRGKGRR